MTFVDETLDTIAVFGSSEDHHLKFSPQHPSHAADGGSATSLAPLGTPSPVICDSPRQAQSASGSSSRPTWLLTETPDTSPALGCASHLQDRDEALLLRYFVTHLAHLFDLTDVHHHFRDVVPQHAMTHPILRNAVFAVAAAHKARIGGGNALVADAYEKRCLALLIPILNDENAVLGEDLLAAMVILRHIEEVNVPLSTTSAPDTEQTSHLIGTYAFVAAQEGFLASGGLRLASYWIGVRQEIYHAFVKQRATVLPLGFFRSGQSLSAADDGTWANRIIAHCADVISCCYGNAPDAQMKDRYTDLLQYANDWIEAVPPSYTPIYRGGKSSHNSFPDIVYCSDAVVTGIQHYHLLMILLFAYDPHIPRLGPQRRAAQRKTDNAILGHLRQLCGLAFSNSSCPPSLVTASMAIALVGDRLTAPEEQIDCLKLLEMIQKDYGWQSTVAQNDLKEAWGCLDRG